MEDKFAFVFPGQGSQSLGMLADINEHYPQVKATFTEASQILGYDLWDLVQRGPQERLDQTFHTQPALLTSSYAIFRIIQERKNIHPLVMAGHSLGEYSALVCAEAISFADAIKLVAGRGQFMQEAVEIGIGAMGAIVGLDEQTVYAICEASRQEDEVLSPANFNSPGQTVIAGHKEAVLRALDIAKTKGAKLAVQLAVSVPSHCLLMKGAAERLAACLATIPIRTPKYPVLNNADVMPYKTPADIRDGLTRQLYQPVRWFSIINKMLEMGVKMIVEVGPGKVLTGLNRRIDKNLIVYTTEDTTNLENFLKTANHSPSGAFDHA